MLCLPLAKKTTTKETNFYLGGDERLEKLISSLPNPQLPVCDHFSLAWVEGSTLNANANVQMCNLFS